MRNVSYKSCRGNQNTHFVFSDFIFPKIVSLRDKVEKYWTAGQAIEENMAHALFMVDI
jgi:hypothetical protein